MKYYVNEIGLEILDIKKLTLDPLKDDEYYVGLFSKCETAGEGSFSGYFASEYYLNTTLFAYAIYKKNGLYLSEKVSDFKKCEKTFFKKIRIGSCFWTRVVKAYNLEKAIEKCNKSKWHDRNSLLDRNVQNSNQL